MNHRLIILPLLFAISSIFANKPSDDQEPPIGWIDAKDAHVEGNVALLDTNKGVAFLKVLQFDEENDRYLVECINAGGEIYPMPDPSCR